MPNSLSFQHATDRGTYHVTVTAHEPQERPVYPDIVVLFEIDVQNNEYPNYLVIKKARGRISRPADIDRLLEKLKKEIIRLLNRDEPGGQSISDEALDLVKHADDALNSPTS